ncbi:MAG: phenylacetate--CoA ligase family protein [Planctomycetia bacterium]|nr:phenylacetate--CoA ligase family protein [Planctomycetia bacterium]
MLDWLFSRVLLPAFETGVKRRRTYQYWSELERSQWYSRGELARLQLTALRRLLAHAQTQCPYYRAAWSHLGLDAAQVDSLTAFERWPVISSDAIREHRLRMRTAGTQLLSKSTGGSSGAPLHFDLDHESHERRTAAWHRGYSWAGAIPGVKQLYLWGVPLGQRTAWQRGKDRVYHWLQRRHLLNTFELSAACVGDFCRRLNAYRPRVIVAYTNPLYEFARALQDRGMRPWSPQAIVVGAEKLHAHQRQLIETVFAAPVFETYGCREVMLIGAECPRHEGLHLTQENLLVEILDDEGQPTPPGQEGNVVLTDLYNHGMPFIRYANGDRAIAGWQECSCGRGLPLLRQVTGRRLDVLHTPDGRRLPGEFFPHLCKDYPAIQRFQVEQTEPDRMQFKVVLGPRWSDADQAQLLHEVRQAIGEAMQVDFLPVTDIPLTRAGKHQVVINRCAVRAMDEPAGAAS